jgi:hypothetical protein
LAGAPVVFVRLKEAAFVTPITEAIMVYVPSIPLAVKAGDVATPFTSVVAVAVSEEVSENVALGPVAGDVNVTMTPEAGVPFEVTVATSAAPNVASMAWLCPVPLVAVIA